MTNDDKKKRGFKEEIEVAGTQLIETIKELIKEGNIRQIKVFAKDREFKMEMPLNIGVLAGGAVTLAAPWLAVIGVIAAFATNVRVQIERTTPADDNSSKDEDTPKAIAPLPSKFSDDHQ